MESEDHGRQYAWDLFDAGSRHLRSHQATIMDLATWLTRSVAIPVSFVISSVASSMGSISWIYRTDPAAPDMVLQQIYPVTIAHLRGRKSPPSPMEISRN